MTYDAAEILCALFLFIGVYSCGQRRRENSLESIAEKCFDGVSAERMLCRQEITVSGHSK